jgi:hypothetical protein
MRQFYNTHRKIFYSFFFLLLLGTGFANAQPFKATETCVPSPACAEDGTVFTEDAARLRPGHGALEMEAQIMCVIPCIPLKRQDLIQ